MTRGVFSPRDTAVRDKDLTPTMKNTEKKPGVALDVGKTATALEKIAAACTGKLQDDILAGRIPIPPAKAMTIARLAPAMRRAQAQSYAATGKPLKLPLYRDVVDAALAALPSQGKGHGAQNEGVVDGLARLLNTTTQIPLPEGGAIEVPPLDTEKYAELLNRLDRALGLVAKVVIDMPRLRGVRPVGEEVKMRERLAALVRYAGLIADMPEAPQPTVTAADALKPDKGTYVLLLSLRQETFFPRIGPFGAVTLPRGYFLYVGSAFGSGGVKGRVGHHALVHKERLHWHLDYARHKMDIEEVWCTYDLVKRECAWARLIHEHLGGDVVVTGFGSADCCKLRRDLRCPAHFFHFRSRPTPSKFLDVLREAVPDQADVEVVDGKAVLKQAGVVSP
jgi:Uri superfamily endonuclease